jgi:CheY-like chemotaxis protein
VGGHEVLQWIRENLRRRAPKTFVFTGSNERRDLDRVKQSRVAAGYNVQPLTPEHLAAMYSGRTILP